MVYLGMSLDGSLMLWMLIYPLSIFATLISTSGSTEVINSDKNASTNAIQDSSAINILKDLTPAQKYLLYLISDLALRKTEEPIQNVIDMNRNQKSTIKSIVAETTHDAMADVHQHQTEDNQADMSIPPADFVGINAFSESSKSDNQNTEFEESETTTEDSATLTVSSSEEAKGHICANVNYPSQTIVTEYSPTGNLETPNTMNIRLSHISNTSDDGPLIGAVKDDANAPIHQTYSDDDSHKTSSVDAVGGRNERPREETVKIEKPKPTSRVISKMKRERYRVTETFDFGSAMEKKNARYSHYQSDRKHGKLPLGDPDFHSNSDKQLGHVQQKKKYDYLKKQHTTGSYSDLQGHRKILGVNDKVTPLTAQHTARHSKQSGTTKPPSVFYFEHVRSKGLVGYKAESFDEQKMIRKSSNRNSYNPSSSFDFIPKAGEASMFTFPKVHDDRNFFDFSDTSNKRRPKITTDADESIINKMMESGSNAIATLRRENSERGKKSNGIARRPNQHKLESTFDFRPTPSIPIQNHLKMESETVKRKTPTSPSTSKMNSSPYISSSQGTELRYKKLEKSRTGFKNLTNVSSQGSVTNSAAISMPDLVLNLSVDTSGIKKMLERLEPLTDQSSLKSNVRKSNLDYQDIYKKTIIGAHPMTLQKNMFVQKDLPEIPIHPFPSNRRKLKFRNKQSADHIRKDATLKDDFSGYKSLEDNVADLSIITSEDDVSDNDLSSFIRKKQSKQKASLSIQTPLATTISRSPNNINVDSPDFGTKRRRLSGNIHKHAFEPTTTHRMQFGNVRKNEDPPVTTSITSSTFLKNNVHPSVIASLTSSDNIHRYRGPVHTGQISSIQFLNDEDYILTNNVTSSDQILSNGYAAEAPIWKSLREVPRNSYPVFITNQTSSGNAHSITNSDMRTRLPSSNEVQMNSYPSVKPSSNTVHESSDSSVLTSLKSSGYVSRNSYSGTTPSHASSGNIYRTPDLDLTRSLKSSNGVQRNAYNSKIGNRKRLDVIHDELYPSTTDHMIQSVNIHENKDLSTKVTVMSSADVNKVVNPFMRISLELSRTGHFKRDWNVATQKNPMNHVIRGIKGESPTLRTNHFRMDNICDHEDLHTNLSTEK